MCVAHGLRQFRFVLKVAYDVVAWGAATAVATVLRYERPGLAPWHAAATVGLALAAVYLAVGLLVRVHQGRAVTGSLEEMLVVAYVAIFSGVVVFAVDQHFMLIARSVPVGATICFVVAAGLGRAVWRSLNQRQPAAPESSSSSRVLVVGAGEAGRDLVGSMLREAGSQWHPVGFLDDDRAKRHLRVRGVPVLGDIAHLGELVEEHRAEVVVVAIPSASSDVIGRIAEASRAAGVSVKVLPSTSELLRDQVGIRDIRDISLGDVLGRKQVDTDVASIAGYLTGRRVLVTGAGGSIGSELCRQIAAFGPSELIMLDRDESALHGVQLSLTGRAMLDGRDVVLCDIRDSAALLQVFLNRRPEVVFHAAALKHLPMLEQYPAEAVKTNVVGTHNVLVAATQAGVSRLVNISTDKAANPSSVLGYSKRLAERITASYARTGTGSYLSVRFGNVLGSRGSVLTAFAGQIARGGPITVTHPDVTRYFMTIEEACQLVVQAGAIGRPGEALVLDMGEPVKILDVAHHLIALDHRRVPIEFTGLREGEKLHEELFGDLEPRDVRPWHSLISHVPVDAIDLDLVAALPVTGRRNDVSAALARACADHLGSADLPPWHDDMEETVVHSRD
ncbi:MAG: nucleoside-diphosphate sugar epimerase/dehydratase [Nocardioides sp.]